MRWFVENSIGIVTALVPVIGYETATEIAKEALTTGRGVYDIVCDRGLMTREDLDRVLDPRYMLGLEQSGVSGMTTEYSAVKDDLPRA
jgi:aspartate ammonia-lyase